MIPVFEPAVGQEEIDAVVDALKKGEISGTFGDYIPEFERQFAHRFGCQFGVAVNSGTSALHLAVAALGLEEGEEVLVSACTNIATALAAVHNRAVPVPVDSEETTWNLDLDRIEGLITSKTRAIIPVHIYGHPVDMDRLMEIAGRHGLYVIEDCAEAHGARCRDRYVGSFGHMACFSFYANKVMTTGEGGMVITNDECLADQVRLLRNLAFTKPRFRHEQAGFNFRMTGYQAAMGLAQLRKIDAIIEKKRWIARTYTECLVGTPALKLPAELDWAFNVYWMYCVVTGNDSGVDRDGLAERLSRKGIQTRTFFCPMNRQPVLIRLPGYREVPCPVADALWESGLYLPSSLSLSEKQIHDISETVRKACAGENQ